MTPACKSKKRPAIADRPHVRTHIRVFHNQRLLRAFIRLEILMFQQKINQPYNFDSIHGRR